MREMWMMAPVLFPVVSGGALWIWNPGKNKIHTAAAVLSLAEAVCSWLVILNCMGMKLPLWSIGPGLELCLGWMEPESCFPVWHPLYGCWWFSLPLNIWNMRRKMPGFSDALLCPWEP